MSDNTIKLPEDKDLAAAVIDGQNTSRQMQMKIGKIGSFVGSGDEKPGNIAFVVLAACFVAILFLLWLHAAYPEARLTEAIASFFTVITTTLGYIYGRKSSE